MFIKNGELDVNSAIEFANYDNLLLKRRKNNILLSDFQVDVLKKNGLDFIKYGNLHDLLFDIEEILNDDYDDELDLVSNQIAELLYYNETKK